MLRALSADFLKIRRKGIWLLVVIAPLGLIAMQALNYGLRYDYMMDSYKGSLWHGLIIGNIFPFVPLSLFLGATLISSLISGIEHQLSSWKQLLALPISKTAVFGAKYALSVILLAAACLLLSLATAGLGLALGFPAELPYKDLATLGFWPFVASLPLLALQLWLSLTLRNQSLPVFLGIAMALGSLFSGNLGEYFPLNWPSLALEKADPGIYLGAGAALGLFIMLLALLHLNRKDVE